MRSYSTTSLDFGKNTSISVYPPLAIFLIPVPSEHGKPLIYPSGHAYAGSELLEFETNKSFKDKDRGFIFFNPVRQMWYGAPTTGHTWLVVHKVSPLLGSLIYPQLGKHNANSLIDYMKKDLSLGDIIPLCREKFNPKHHDPYLGDLKPIGNMHRKDLSGFYRSSRDRMQVIRLDGEGWIDNNGHGLRFDRHTIALKNSDGNIAMMAWEEFKSLYTSRDEILNFDKIPSQKPKSIEISPKYPSLHRPQMG